MTDSRETIGTDLAARYTKLAGVVRELAAPLNDEQFWAKPFSFGNSFGHLVLHLTGNLNYYIGAQIAQTGYVRNRPLEFTETTRPSKDDVLKKFDEANAMVVKTIRSQSVDDWGRPYSAAGTDEHDRFGILLSCVTHLHLHIGQMTYLGFELKRQN